MHQAFNANFFIVSATVIPLLYLTLTLQGPVFEDLIRTARKVGQATEEYANGRGKVIDSPSWLGLMVRLGGETAPSWLYSAVGMAIFGLGAFIILAGVIGEIISVWDLFYQRTSYDSGHLVLWSMIGLLALLAVRPAIAIFKVTFINWTDPDSKSTKEKT